MSIEKSYTEARAGFAEMMDRVRDDREIVIITRRGQPEAALIAVDELEGLLETAHLLRSPKNAQRLLTALNRALERTETVTTLRALRGELGFGASD